jgi:hypothetical protein
MLRSSSVCAVSWSRETRPHSAIISPDFQTRDPAFSPAGSRRAGLSCLWAYAAIQAKRVMAHLLPVDAAQQFGLCRQLVS